jgi:hypothetical protein
VADLSGGLLVLGGTALGGVIASGTAFLQARWALRRDEEARAAARRDDRRQFQRNALVALEGAIPGLMQAIEKMEAGDPGSVEAVRLSTWEFHTLHSKVADSYVLMAARELAQALEAVTDEGPSPQRVEAVRDGAYELLARIGNVVSF